MLQPLAARRNPRFFLSLCLLLTITSPHIHDGVCAWVLKTSTPAYVLAAKKEEGTGIWTFQLPRGMWPQPPTPKTDLVRYSLIIGRVCVCLEVKTWKLSKAFSFPLWASSSFCVLVPASGLLFNQLLKGKGIGWSRKAPIFSTPPTASSHSACHGEERARITGKVRTSGAAWY